MSIGTIVPSDPGGKTKERKYSGGRGYVPKGTRHLPTPGAGRKKSVEKLASKGLTEQIEAHASELAEIQEIDRKTGSVKIIKKMRTLALLDVLFNEGMKKNIPAVKEYFDRTLGKAPQSIDLKHFIKPEEQRPPSREEIEAGQAYEKALARSA